MARNDLRLPGRPAPAAATATLIELYNLIAGPEPFVETCLGTGVEDARATFRAFAADPWWEGRLLEVAER